MDEWTVLLYLFTNSSKISVYFLVEFAEKYLKFFFHGSVPTLNDARFLFVFGRIQFNELLHMFIVEYFALVYPEFLWSFRSLNTFCKALATSVPVLFFKGIIHPYLEKISTTVNRYLTPLLYLENACMSTKSAAHILWMPLT